jgi:hypothetical protein
VKSSGRCWPFGASTRTLVKVSYPVTVKSWWMRSGARGLRRRRLAAGAIDGVYADQDDGPGAQRSRRPREVCTTKVPALVVPAATRATIRRGSSHVASSPNRHARSVSDGSGLRRRCVCQGSRRAVVAALKAEAMWSGRPRADLWTADQVADFLHRSPGGVRRSAQLGSCLWPRRRAIPGPGFGQTGNAGRSDRRPTRVRRAAIRTFTAIEWPRASGSTQVYSVASTAASTATAALKRHDEWAASSMTSRLNVRLLPVFQEMLPALTAAGLQYWIYGGVGVAGAVGRFLRTNGDVDIYVVVNEFDQVRECLLRLCAVASTGGGEGAGPLGPRALAQYPARTRLSVATPPQGAARSPSWWGRGCRRLRGTRT